MTLTRRTLTRGIAWSVPALAATTAAPAFAVSVDPSNVKLSRYTNYTAPASGCANSGYKVVLDGTSQGSSGVTITNANSIAATVTGLYTVFLSTKKDLTFTANSGYTKWSNPVATGVTQVINGTTHYQYRSNYSDSVTIAANSTAYVLYSFTSSCTTGTTGMTGGQAFGTVNGTAIQSPASTVYGSCTINNCQ